MKSKSLKETNRHLTGDPARARAMRIRSLASSTAIETGEPIEVIEERLRVKQPSRRRVELA